MFKYFITMVIFVIFFLTFNLTVELNKLQENLQELKQLQKTEIITNTELNNTHNISLLEIPYGNYYQIIIPSNDGLSAFNVFVTPSDLYELKEIIYAIEKKEAKK